MRVGRGVCSLTASLRVAFPNHLGFSASGFLRPDRAICKNPRTIPSSMVGVICGTARRSRAPSSQPPCLLFFPEWRCASPPSFAWRHANVFLRAKTIPHHPAESPRPDRLRAASSRSRPSQPEFARADVCATLFARPART